ncbi:Uncharacterised protein [Edwardsiella tarda]|nr:Uncharacterised protein [Edwardsiella tarda]
MHEHGVFTTDIDRQLADGFQERQRFDITDGTADFDQNHVVAFAPFQDALFDGVSDMRDHLHGGAQIVAAALFAQHIGVDTPGGEVIAAGHLGANETLVVTQVQIGFRAVFGDENFPVLDRAHGTRIDVDVRVELHHGYIEATGFKNGRQGGCGNAFTQRGYDPAGHKNIIRCHAEPES